MSERAKFTYDGHLVFNEIFDFHPQITDQELNDALPAYDAESPGDGFENINITDRYSEFGNSLDVNESWLSEISTYRYAYDELKETEAYVDGELRKVHIPTKRTADLFTSSGRSFIRGSTNDSRKAIDRLQEVLSPGKLNSIKFESDFLLWLLYRHFRELDFGEVFHIDRLTDAKVRGSKDKFGEFNSVSGSTELLRSPPILEGVLTGKDIVMIGGYFLIDGHFLRANISDDRVHIKTTDEMQDLSDLERVILSIKFLDEICELHDTWHNLPPEEKFPTASFFDAIVNSLHEEGFAVNYPVQQTIEKYAEKRRGDTL